MAIEFSENKCLQNEITSISLAIFNPFNRSEGLFWYFHYEEELASE